MTEMRDRDELLIAVVGPCASGKTTLVEALKAHGYDARQIAQEHSHVPSMWEQITKPDLLIYLDAPYETCTARKDLNWTIEEYRTQTERLSDARERCDLYIDTDISNPEEVFRTAVNFLESLSS
jgi:deoxyadenosine/deoxycytidine kinase